MRDYQPKKNNKYLLPGTLYKLTLQLIRDHERKKTVYNNIPDESKQRSDGMPRGSSMGNPTQNDGIRLAEMKDTIDAVENALAEIPEEYRRGVWENIVRGKRYPDDADRATYSRHKRKFIYNVARNMLWI